MQRSALAARGCGILNNLNKTRVDAAACGACVCARACADTKSDYPGDDDDETDEDDDDVDDDGNVSARKPALRMTCSRRRRRCVVVVRAQIKLHTRIALELLLLHL